MDDIIRHGPQGEPNRLIRPALSVLILVTMIVVAVVAIGHLPRHRAGGSHRPAAVIAAGPVQLAGLGSDAARMLNGDHPALMPDLAGHHPGRCGHIRPGNQDFQLASLAGCH